MADDTKGRSKGWYLGELCMWKAGKRFEVDAMMHMKKFAQENEYFTCEDLRLSYEGTKPHDARAWGPVLRWGYTDGMMEYDSMSVASTRHGADVKRWKSLIYKGGNDADIRGRNTGRDEQEAEEAGTE